MDIATIIVLGKALLELPEGKREVIPRKITLPVPIFTPDPEIIARKDVVPQCAFGEKLTWIWGQEKYVCLPSMK